MLTSARRIWWILVVLTGAVTAIWIGSMFVLIGREWDSSRVTTIVSRGVLMMVVRDAPQAHSSTQWFVQRQKYPPIFVLQIQRNRTHLYILIPLWIPVILFAGGTIAVWWFKRHRDGACPACGYSLVGIPAGQCPECGWQPPAAEQQTSAR